MVSIYEMKKVKFDFIINIYLIFITILSVFVSINKIFAFSVGIDIGTNIASNSRGISLTDLVSGTSLGESAYLQLLISLIFVFLFVLFILNIVYYSNIKKKKYQTIKQLQIFSIILYLLLIYIFSILFTHGTKSTDYKYIRIYGTALFGILGLLSFLILGILECYWILKSFNSVQSNNTVMKTVQTDGNQYQIPKASPPKQTGMTLINLYQGFLGISFVLIGIGVYGLSTVCISFGSPGACQSSQTDGLRFISFLVILWGFFGVSSAILFNLWNYYGYLMTWAFLISTGLILFVFYLIPTICMIISLYYFKTNIQFKENLNFIKSQNASP